MYFFYNRSFTTMLKIVDNMLRIGSNLKKTDFGTAFLQLKIIEVVKVKGSENG